MHDMVFRGRGGGQFWAKDYKSHQVLRNVKLDEVAILIFCDLNLFFLAAGYCTPSGGGSSTV